MGSSRKRQSRSGKTTTEQSRLSHSKVRRKESGGEVIGCHSNEAWEEQLQKGEDFNKPIAVDFTASWCAPCRVISPFFSELAKKFPDVIFLKVDVDELQQVAKEWGVDVMPTFVLVKEGKVVGRVVGARKDELQQMIVKHAPAAAADMPAA